MDRSCKLRLNSKRRFSLTDITRSLGIEQFESRVMLSVTSADITGVVLTINDMQHAVTDSESFVTVNRGDVVEVEKVDYVAEGEPGGDSVLAIEAYFRKSGSFDYDDGRFGDTAGHDVFDEQTELLVDGGWTVEADWDRMSIPLMFYGGDQAVAQDRFFINFQVEDNRDLRYSARDTMFALRAESFSAGKSTDLWASWRNDSPSPQKAVTSVEITNVSDRSAVVWTGRFTATVAPSETATGAFLDDQGEMWTPERSGVYRVRFEVDVDGLLEETNERNNEGAWVIRVR